MNKPALTAMIVLEALLWPNSPWKCVVHSIIQQVYWRKRSYPRQGCQWKPTALPCRPNDRPLVPPSELPMDMLIPTDHNHRQQMMRNFAKRTDWSADSFYRNDQSMPSFLESFNPRQCGCNCRRVYALLVLGFCAVKAGTNHEKGLLIAGLWCFLVLVLTPYSHMKDGFGSTAGSSCENGLNMSRQQPENINDVLDILGFSDWGWKTSV